MSNAQVRDLQTWKEFLDEVLKIEREILERSHQTIGYQSRPLYRGQANADWKLRTTLERECERPLSMSHYQKHHVGKTHTILSGFQQRHWPFDRNAAFTYEAMEFGPLPNYEFMAYLRHHGFPSPLLDWTSSPYVAAFFAFESAYTSDRVAIFWYQEYQGQGKSSYGGTPRIRAAGPFAAIHPRHFVQQSEYTICYMQEKEEAVFAPHESVVNGKSVWPQDAVIKFTLPRALRSEVIFELNRMNINPYSVYQSEDALVRTLGNRVLIEDEQSALLFSKQKEVIDKAREGNNAPWQRDEG
jgi:hypothetical protein